MKVIRNLLVGLLTFFLYIFVGVLLISCSVENLVQKELFTGLVTNTIIENNDLTEEQKNQLEDIAKDEETQQLITEIISAVSSKYSGGEGIDDATVEKIIDYIISHKEKLEELTGQEIDINEIEKLRNNDEIQEAKENFNNSIISVDVPEEAKDLLRLYSNVTSKELKIYLCGIIGAIVLLIALLQWSLYKWLKVFGGVATSDGVTLLIFYFLAKLVMDNLLTDMPVISSFDFSYILKLSLITIAIGVACIIIYFILNAIFKKKNKDNDTNEDNVVYDGDQKIENGYNIVTDSNNSNETTNNNE